MCLNKIWRVPKPALMETPPLLYCLNFWLYLDTHFKFLIIIKSKNNKINF